MSELARVEAAAYDGARLIRIAGEIDLSNARHVLSLIAAEVPHDATRVVVDLGGLTFLDSSGIAMLFRLAERLGYSRQELRLVVPATTPIRTVLELTSVGQVIPVHELLDDVPRGP